MPEPAHNTHHKTISYGKHEGELFTRIPASYLRWMVNEGAKEWHFAQAELDRRGTTLPDIEVSRHAIDRASLRCLQIWNASALNTDEGLLSWIERMGQEAIEADPKNTSGTYRYNPTGAEHYGLQIIIEHGEQYPIVKTIMPKKGKPTAAV